MVNFEKGNLTKKNRPNLSGWKLQPFSSSRSQGAAADFDRLSDQRKNSVISVTTGARDTHAYEEDSLSEAQSQDLR